MAEDKQAQATGGEIYEPAAKLYKNLLNEGYTEANLGTETEFCGRMFKDEESRRKLYNHLVKDGYGNNVGDYDDFNATMAVSGLTHNQIRSLSRELQANKDKAMKELEVYKEVRTPAQTFVTTGGAAPAPQKPMTILKPGYEEAKQRLWSDESERQLNLYRRAELMLDKSLLKKETQSQRDYAKAKRDEAATLATTGAMVNTQGPLTPGAPTITPQYIPAGKSVQSATDETNALDMVSIYTDRTEELLKAPLKHKSEGLLDATGDAISGTAQGFADIFAHPENYPIVGPIVSTANDQKVQSLFKKANNGEELTEAETMAYLSYMNYLEAAQKIEPELAMSYNVGKAVGYSTSFALEMMMTGGLQAKGFAAIARSLARHGQKGAAAKVAAWLGDAAAMEKIKGAKAVRSQMNVMEKGLGQVAQDLMQTTVMPSTYSGIVADQTDAVTKGDDYEFKDVIRSLAGSGTEVVTEGTVGKVIDAGLKHTPLKRFVNHFYGSGSKLGRAHTKIQSPISENAEEYAGALMDYVRSYNPMFDEESNAQLREGAMQQFSGEGATETALTVLLNPLQIAGLGAQGVTDAVNRKALGNIKKNYDEAENRIAELIAQTQGVDMNTAKGIITKSLKAECANMDEVADKLNILSRNLYTLDVENCKAQGIDESVARDRLKKNRDAIRKYFEAYGRYNQVIGAIAEQYNGLSDIQKQEIDNIVDEYRRTHENSIVTEAQDKVSGSENETNGRVQEVTLYGQEDKAPAKVLRGSVVVTTNEEGKPIIDKHKSDALITIEDENGVRQTSINEIMEVIGDASQEEVDSAIRASEFIEEKHKLSFPVGSIIQSIQSPGRYSVVTRSDGTGVYIATSDSEGNIDSVNIANGEGELAEGFAVLDPEENALLGKLGGEMLTYAGRDASGNVLIGHSNGLIEPVDPNSLSAYLENLEQPTREEIEAYNAQATPSEETEEANQTEQQEEPSQLEKDIAQYDYFASMGDKEFISSNLAAAKKELKQANSRKPTSIEVDKRRSQLEEIAAEREAARKNVERWQAAQDFITERDKAQQAEQAEVTKDTATTSADTKTAEQSDSMPTPEAMAAQLKEEKGGSLQASSLVSLTINDYNKKINTLSEKIKKTSLADMDKRSKLKESMELLKEQKAYWSSVSDILKGELTKGNDSHVSAADLIAQREAEKARRQQALEEQGFYKPGKIVGEKWDAAPKKEGNTMIKTLADGTTVKGRFILVPAEALTPSHDGLNDYEIMEGAPVREDGTTVNSRDYKNSKDNQALTNNMAVDYDGQAVNDTPVTHRGNVYSGNGRTIAGQIAAAKGTDTKYTEALKANAQMYGFSAEDVDAIPHARLVFELDEEMPYTPEVYAKFNQETMKKESSTEQAVASSKTLSETTAIKIADIIDGYANIDSYFASADAATSTLSMLVEEGVIGANEMPELRDRNGKLTDTGKERITNILLGAMLEEDTIRAISEMPSLKQLAVRLAKQLLANRKYKSGSLLPEVNAALRLVASSRKQGYSVQENLKQTDLFGQGAADTHSIIEKCLAVSFEEGVGISKDLLDFINQKSADCLGISDIFTGKIYDKQSVADSAVEYYNNVILNKDYGKDRQQREIPNSGQETADRGAGEGEYLRSGPGSNDGETSEEQEAKSRQRAVEAAVKFASELGVKPVIIRKGEEEKLTRQAQQVLAAGERFTAYYDKTRNEVVIYEPYFHTDASKAVGAMAHEIVAHKGLREMLGEERFNELLDNVWDAMSDAAKDYYASYIYSGASDTTLRKLGLDRGLDTGNPLIARQIRSKLSKDKELTRQAADECIAGYAETQRFDGVVQAIRNFLNKILSAITGEKIELTADNIKDLLQASAQNLREKKKKADENQRRLEERKQRILKNGTSNDKPFGLKPVSESMSADDIISNINKIISTLKQSGDKKDEFSLFKGFAINGDYARNAGEQVREYIIALDGVVPQETLNQVYRTLGFETFSDITEYGRKMYNSIKATEAGDSKKKEENITADNNVEEVRSNKPAPRKIEDFGEKIGGARKDIASEIADKINPNGNTFSKVFPKFDMHKLLEKGLDPKMAASLKFCISIAKKNYKQNKKRYGEEKALSAAAFYAAYAKRMLEGETTPVGFTSNGWVFTETGIKLIEANIELYKRLEDIYGEGMHDIDFSDYEISYTIPKPGASLTYSYKDKEGKWQTETIDTPFYTYMSRSNIYKPEKLEDLYKDALEHIQRSVSYDATHKYNIRLYVMRSSGKHRLGVKVGSEIVFLTEEGDYDYGYINEHNAELQALAERKIAEMRAGRKAEGKKAEIDIVSEYVDGARKYTIAVKLDKQWKSISHYVGSRDYKSLLDYKKEHSDELQEKAQQILDEYEAGKKFKPELNLTQERRRIGDDHRQGHDVSPERFSEVFGFRGVEFGNYVTAKERQQSLNDAFDALLDMADVIGVSPKALSLNGQLSLAFGARGKSSAKAHYEPNKNVINITKKHGAGSLAHEYFHALDYYFGQREKGGTATESKFVDDVRPEVAEAFNSLMETIKKSDYFKRSKALEDLIHPNVVLINGIDPRYYVQPTELGARAFGDYIIRKLSDKGHVNDYLSSFTRVDEWNGNPDVYPFPIDSDAEAINKAFDKLFDTIQEKEVEDRRVLFQLDSSADEIEAIRKKAIADGTFMKAPNGKPTKLSERQWLQVRTRAFKEWFGDWEKRNRIEKLRKSEPISITGNEFEHSDDIKQYRKNAEKYAKTLRGKYTNKDTGAEIELTSSRSNGGIREILEHDYKDVWHLQSVAAIPQIIENSIYITSIENEDTKVDAKHFDYYVCGLRIGDDDYTVKSVIVTLSDGTRYYDHKLTKIEKGRLIDLINKLPDSASNPISSESSAKSGNDFTSKDTRLFSILQENSSKIVDENGEPMVVYHQTNSKRYVNKETGEDWGSLDWKERLAWDERSDWDEYWKEQDFYTFDRRNARESIEMPAYFFTPQYDEYHEYGNRTIPAFLNIKNPAVNPAIPNAGVTDTAGRDAMEDLIAQGYDGFIRTEEDGVVYETNAFESNQIKSATINNGDFSRGNDDIRFQLIGETGAKSLDNAEEASYRIDGLKVARDMEKEGYSTKEVRMATGWERGADNLWRYEVSDISEDDLKNAITKANNEFKRRRFEEDVKEDNLRNAAWRIYDRLPRRLDSRYSDEEKVKFKELRKRADQLFKEASEARERRLELENNYERNGIQMTLGDVLSKDSELMRAYPELADTKVLFPYLGDTKNGSYNPKTKEIKLNRSLNIKNLYSTLNHEVQHAIQDMEGFASGGSATDVLTSNIKEVLKSDLKKKLELKQQKLTAVESIMKSSGSELKDYAELEGKSVEDAMKSWSEEKKRLQEDKEEIEYMLDGIDKGYLRSDEAYEYYRRIAGEVEARNVQRRLNMGKEERRSTLLKDTEDVAREDQLFIVDNLSDSKSDKENTLFQRTFVNGLNSQDEVFNSIQENTRWSNGAVNLMSALEKYHNGPVIAASSGAKKAMSEGLVPVPGEKFSGEEGEYHHLKFNVIGEGESVIAVPFAKAEDVEDKYGIRFQMKKAPSKYTARDGRAVEFRQLSLFDNSEEPSEQLKEEDKDVFRSGYYNLKPGEFSDVERVFTERGYFEFTAKNKIKSPEDVAYIFKQLETESVENSFGVLIDKNDKPYIIHLGIGSSSQTLVDAHALIAAADRVKPQKVYFIHNHPSGSLRASKPDVQAHQALKQALGGVLQDGIIIDTISGKFVTFNSTSTEKHNMPENQEGAVPVEVHSFSKRVFGKDYDYSGKRVENIYDVASFLSSMRFGQRSKVGMLALTQDNQITANIFIPEKLEKVDPVEIIGKIATFGGTSYILYSNEYSLDRRELGRIVRKIRDAAKPANIREVDVMLINSSHDDHVYVGASQAAGDVAFQLSTSRSRGETLHDLLETAMFENSTRIDARGVSGRKYVGKQLGTISKAFSAGRLLTIDSADAIINFAKNVIDANGMSDITRYEIKRILGKVRKATAKVDQKEEIEAIFDLLLGHSIANSEGVLNKLLKYKVTDVNPSGVSVAKNVDSATRVLVEKLNEHINSDIDRIEELISEADDKLGEVLAKGDTASKQEKDEARAAVYGLKYAKAYKETVKATKDDIADLTLELRKQQRKLVGLRGKAREGQIEVIDSIKDNIRELKLTLLNEVDTLSAEVLERINIGMEKRGDWLTEQQEHKSAILHYAFSDLFGVKAEKNAKKQSGNWLKELFLSPIYTLDTMLKSFAPTAVEGKGYLYNHFIPGCIKASQKEFKRFSEAIKILDAKCEELFGKGMNYNKVMAQVAREPREVTLEWFESEDGSTKEQTLTVGQIMYIYMVNKMTDGKMKLKNMKITEENVEEMKKMLPDEIVKLADWIQEDFLPGRKVEYNKTHRELFGRPMDEVENYIPLAIASEAVDKKVDVNDSEEQGAMSSTITGSIIKRKRNKKSIDIANTDGMAIVLRHLRDMEHWSAFSPVARDFNTLLSSRLFRNKINAINPDNFRLFKSVAQIATGNYKPKSSRTGMLATKLVKLIGSSKIAFRLNTALKQFLSYPAYWSEVGTTPNFFTNLLKSTALPYQSVKWCYDNLPLFRKRWDSKASGQEYYNLSDVNWETRFGKMFEKVAKVGMIPNAVVDLIVCSYGAKAMYESKYTNYLRRGYSEENAKARAIIDAELIYNLSQQSTEGFAMSALQMDNGIESRAISLFNNSSFSYGRQFIQACRGLHSYFKHKDEMVEYRKKQLIRDGVSEDKAAEYAIMDVERDRVRNIARVAIYGFVIQAIWNLGGIGWSLLNAAFSDDDDEKQAAVEDIVKNTGLAVVQPVRGLVGGATLESLMSAMVNERQFRPGEGLHPGVSDAADAVESVYRMATSKNSSSSDILEVMNSTLNASASFVGVQPQTFVTAFDGISDLVTTNKDLTWLDVRQDLAMILNAPPSQINKMAMRPRKGETFEEFMDRYTDYKKLQKEGLFSIFDSDYELSKRKRKEMRMLYKKNNK